MQTILMHPDLMVFHLHVMQEAGAVWHAVIWHREEKQTQDMKMGIAENKTEQLLKKVQENIFSFCENQLETQIWKVLVALLGNHLHARLWHLPTHQNITSLRESKRSETKKCMHWWQPKNF